MWHITCMFAVLSFTHTCRNPWLQTTAAAASSSSHCPGCRCHGNLSMMSNPLEGGWGKNGSTHSYAGAFLRRGVPIMAASSPSSLFPSLRSSPRLMLIHLGNDRSSPFPEISDGCWIEACSLLQLCLACSRRERKWERESEWEKQRQEGGSHLFNILLYWKRICFPLLLKTRL